VLTLFLSFLSIPTVVLAHSTVSPSQASTSKYETFTLSVPVEKDVPTVAVKLLIPDSLDKVMPFVKPGWKINIKKEKVGEVEKITEIEWIGGTIPAGQKDVFQFTARTPQTDTNLIWKVYQTYSGGEIVSWDQDPKSESEIKYPYSETKVSESLPPTDNKVIPADTNKQVTDIKSYINILPLLISFIALVVAYRKK
jgi:uncharacterized protein YcnI